MQSIVLQDSGDQIKHWLTRERGAWSGLLLRSPAFLVLFVCVLTFQIVGCQGTGGTDAAGPVDSAPPAPNADAAVANGGDVAEADVAAVPDVRPSRDAAEIPPPSPPRPAFSVGAPAPIFDPTRVCSVRLDLSDAEWTRLGTAPSEWATAHFTVSGCGATLGPVEVGVRIHGNNPANQNLANAPPLKLNFGFPEPDARLLGMRRLTLHRTDPTLVRETLAYGLFRAAGLPTPATGFARVELHGSDMGVYVLVETSDRHLAERLFPTTGHIYEAEEPWTDLGPHDLQGFEPEVGANTDTTDLTALSDSLDSATLSDRVDWDEVLTYLAMERVLGVRDGYMGKQAHYLLHLDEGGVARMLPWAQDESLRSDPDDSEVAQLERSIRLDRASRPLLLAICLRQPACAARYLEALDAAVALARTTPLETELLALNTVLGPYDPDPAGALDARLGVLAELAAHVDQVAASLVCEHSPAVDADGDGVPCALDCDDDSAASYPGAPEVCPDASTTVPPDLDCDGLGGDAPECDCTPVSFGPHTYWKCVRARSFDEATQRCHTLGADLLVVNTAAEVVRLMEIERGQRERGYWLGLTDRETEGTYRWVDGTPLTEQPFLGWVRGRGQPQVDTDCVALLPQGGLDEEDCGARLPFVCEETCAPGLPGNEQDGDGDGHLRCGDDCDDGNAGTFAGMPDDFVCDHDNDCDGYISSRCPESSDD